LQPLAVGEIDFMKKFLSLIFIACLLQAGLLGCDGGCPPEPPQLEPFYINNSGVAVRITVIMEDGNTLFGDSYYRYRYTQEIKDNDTLCNSYLNESCAVSRWEIPNGYEGCHFITPYAKPAYFKIEFLGESKACLIFDGEVGENDIRYCENYTLMKKGSTIVYYSYTITPKHKNIAKEEYCEE